MKRGSIAALAVASLLTACGGGGSGNDDRGPRAAGVYEGSTSNGGAFQALVLDDDQFWALYGVEVGDLFYIAGFLQGQAASGRGRITSSDIRDFGDSPAASGTLEGAFSAGASITGARRSASGTVAFNGTAVAPEDFAYDSPADIAAIAGDWNMIGLGGAVASVSIAASGAVTGESDGCIYAGTVAPHASGKNVFSVTATFGGAACARPGQTAIGIAVSHLVNGGPLRRLLVLATDAARREGIGLVGVR